MKKLVLISSFIVLSAWLYSESIYTLSVTSIEGVNKPLNAYQGKKILLITLPVHRTNSNDSLLRSLDSLRNSYNGSLIIIGTPSYEDGYRDSLKNSLKQWYRSFLSMNIVVTKGMYTRKTSGNQQHILYRWLTDKSKNNHFDKDIYGPKEKFVVWTNGELVGVLGPYSKIGGSTLNNLLQGQ